MIVLEDFSSFDWCLLEWYFSSNLRYVCNLCCDAHMWKGNPISDDEKTKKVIGCVWNLFSTTHMAVSSSLSIMIIASAEFNWAVSRQTWALLLSGALCVPKLLLLRVLSTSTDKEVNFEKVAWKPNLSAEKQLRFGIIFEKWANFEWANTFCVCRHQKYPTATILYALIPKF